MIHTKYLGNVLNPTELISRITLAAEKLKNVSFDAIAVTGNSGALIGGALSYILAKPIILVRKKQDQNPVWAGGAHTYAVVEGPDEDSARTYLFVDELISTGETKRRVIEEIRGRFPGLRCVGSYQLDYNLYIEDETQ